MQSDRISSLVKEIDGLFEMENDWTRLYDAICGVDGLLRSALTPADRAEFMATPEYSDVMDRLAQVRKARVESEKDPCRVITVRLPASVHASLRAEAHDMHTSMNKLCITKLILPVKQSLVPTDSKLPVAAST